MQLNSTQGNSRTMDELQIDTHLANTNRPYYRRKYTDQGPSFSQFHYELPVFHNELPVQVVLEARMDKGFFLANNYWTCYRRNYFQLSASLQLINDESITGIDNTTIMINNRHHKVIDFYVSVVAKVSTNDKCIDLVQHTAKRDKGPQATPQAKKIQVGGSLSNVNSLTTTHAIATFERIQFKSATANNGKRRAQQQFFMLLLEVLADIEVDGNIVQKRVGFAISDHLVVRGRSPGHYSDTHVERAGMVAMQQNEDYSHIYSQDRNNMYAYAPYSPNSIGMQSNNSSMPSSPTKQGMPVLDMPMNNQMYSMELPIRPASAPMEYYNVEQPSIESLEQFSSQMQKIQQQMANQMNSFQTPPMNQYTPDILNYNQSAPMSRSISPFIENQTYYNDQSSMHQQQPAYYSVSAPGSRSVSPFQMDPVPYMPITETSSQATNQE